MLRAKRRKKRYFKPDKSIYRVNERIRMPQVKVIDEEGKLVGIMPIDKALKLAREKELDLVEVFPKSRPPVCKILNYGQFQYQQSRKAQEQKAKVKKIETKGIRISYKMGRHDLDFRKTQALKFLNKGDKVKIEMILRGRERRFANDAREKIRDFVKSLSTEAEIKIEQSLKKQGGQLFILISPKS